MTAYVRVAHCGKVNSAEAIGFLTGPYASQLPSQPSVHHIISVVSCNPCSQQLFAGSALRSPEFRSPLAAALSPPEACAAATSLVTSSLVNTT